MDPQAETGARWSEILTREYASKLATLALAIWLHASNSMLTATTMPSAVEDIGGLNLISWTFAALPDGFDNIRCIGEFTG